MLLTVVLICVFFATFFVLWTWNFTYWKRRGVPGPKPHWIYGNTKSFISRSQSYAIELEKIYDKYRNNGYPFVGYYAGRTPTILVTDPLLTREILIKNFTHFYNNEVSDMLSVSSDPILWRNPFFQKSETWKASRSELVPGFTINRVKTFYPSIQEVCKKLIKRVDKTLGDENGRDVDFDDLTGRFTTEVCANVIFGINSGALGFEESLVFDMGKEFITQFDRVSTFFISTGWLSKIKLFHKFNVINKKMKQFYLHVMKSSVEAREQKGVKDDFLQFLIQLRDKKKISLTEMTAHAMTFYLDGYDTSAIVMASALYELAQNPLVQDKLRDEIESVAQANNGNISFDNLMGMEYLDHVINETNRLHPPIGMIVKQCTKTFQFKHPDHAKTIEIQEGTPVMVHIARIHKDPNNYPDALKFDPDRFSPEFGGAKKFNEDGIFLAFGGGPRTCLGMRFALAQIKAFVCEMIRHHKFSLNLHPSTETPINPGHFFNYPANKIMLRVERL